MFKKLLLATICFFGACNPGIVLADNGVQVDSLWNGLRTNSGQPLNGGKVYTYDAGTTTPRTLYTDISKTTAATNPIILNSAGQALVFGDGLYKFVVKDKNDVTLYTRDNLVYTNIDTTSVVNAGASTGSSNAYVATPSPAISSYTNGLQIYFVANHTNTGAATLNVNGLGTKAIVRASDAALTAGDIPSGSIVSLLYVDGSPGKFRTLAPLNFFANNQTNTPTATNTYDIGSASLKFKDAYIKGTAYLNTLAPDTTETYDLGTTALKYRVGYFNGIYANVTDGADNSLLTIGHSAVSRGGNAIFYGNEHATQPGKAKILSGDIANGDIELISQNATSKITLGTANTNRWYINSSGHQVPASDGAYDIGASGTAAQHVYGYGVILTNRSSPPTTPPSGTAMIYFKSGTNCLAIIYDDGSVDDAIACK